MKEFYMPVLNNKTGKVETQELSFEELLTRPELAKGLLNEYEIKLYNFKHIVKTLKKRIKILRKVK